MKTVMYAIIAISLTVACAAIVYADETSKITLNTQDTPLQTVIEEITKQTGVSIVLDPNAKGTVTASLTGVELGQALDVICKPNNYTWKKMQFAKPEDSRVALDQLKAAAVALASMPVVGLSMEDPASKTSTVFAKDLPAAPDTSAIKLPEGYSWTSVYVVLAPMEITATQNNDPNKIKSLADAEVKRMVEMAQMSPQERQQVYAQEYMSQLNLPDEIRRDLMQDRMRAMFSLDEQSRRQLREDMRSIFSQMRDQTRPEGRDWSGDRDRRGRGNRN